MLISRTQTHPVQCRFLKAALGINEKGGGGARLTNSYSQRAGSPMRVRRRRGRRTYRTRRSGWTYRRKGALVGGLYRVGGVEIGGQGDSAVIEALQGGEVRQQLGQQLRLLQPHRVVLQLHSYGWTLDDFIPYPAEANEACRIQTCPLRPLYMAAFRSKHCSVDFPCQRSCHIPKTDRGHPGRHFIPSGDGWDTLQVLTVKILKPRWQQQISYLPDFLPLIILWNIYIS